MSTRLTAALCLWTYLLVPLPALAQAPDFGADTSPWANDGECDDPRFTGSRMAQTTVEADRLADATDCRAAFQAGTVQLASGEPSTPTTPVATVPAEVEAVPRPKATPATPQPVATEAGSAAPGQVQFGDDSSEWANDGECDDRRFTGQGMATSMDWRSVGRDASDCRALYDAGSIRLWNPLEAQAATQCAAIDFGDNTSQFADDGECDDPRFEGLAQSTVVNLSESGHDSNDCVQLCAYGAVSLRNY